MSRPTLEVADIFRAQADNFINKHDLGVQQLKVIRAIVRCRTAALGGHADVCPRCGGDPVISYNSCAIVIATSVKLKHVVDGSTRGSGNCFQPDTSTWSSRCRMNSTRSSFRIKRNSTTSCFVPWLKHSARLHAIPRISEPRLVFSAFFTRGVRTCSFIPTFTA